VIRDCTTLEWRDQQRSSQMLNRALHQTEP
jgi:hypothetical protein